MNANKKGIYISTELIRNSVSTSQNHIFQNVTIFSTFFSKILGTFNVDTLKIYLPTLGARDDISSDLHTAIIASEY